MLNRVTVGVGDLAVSNKEGDEIITFSLGSCVGVAIWDRQVKVGGLLHVMLPESKLNPQRAQKQPGVFTDTGLPLLFKSCYKLGAQKNRIRVVVVGGSQVMDSAGHFNIGKRNYTAVRKMFYKKQRAGGRRRCWRQCKPHLGLECFHRQGVD